MHCVPGAPNPGNPIPKPASTACIFQTVRGLAKGVGFRGLGFRGVGFRTADEKICYVARAHQADCSILTLVRKE